GGQARGGGAEQVRCARRRGRRRGPRQPGARGGAAGADRFRGFGPGRARGPAPPDGGSARGPRAGSRRGGGTVVNERLREARRLVVKIGSALLVDPDTGTIHSRWLEALAGDIAELKAQGKEVLIVSSGAIALGR